MKLESYLKRARAHDRRIGIRALDTMVRSLRCKRCNNEIFRTYRLYRIAFTTVGAVGDRILAGFTKEVRWPCARCGGDEHVGDGSHHVMSLYSERLEAHLVLRVVLDRQERSQRSQSSPSIDLSVVVGVGDEEITTGEPCEATLAKFWVDSEIRCATSSPDTLAAIQALERLATKHPQDPFVYRELGRRFIENDEHDRACVALQTALTCAPSHVGIARELASLLEISNQPSEAYDTLMRARGDQSTPELVSQLVRLAYRARRHEAVRTQAACLLDQDPWDLCAHKAMTSVQSAEDVASMRVHWERLLDSSTRAGERATINVARGWIDVLMLPIPSWKRQWSTSQYAREIERELLMHGYEVSSPRDLDMPALLWPDLEVRDPFGFVVALYLQNALFGPHVEQTMRVAIRALSEDERGQQMRLLVLGRYPMPYRLARMVARVPDAFTDLAADADTSLDVAHENAETFVETAEHIYGRTLDRSLASLEEVDAILDQCHEHGLGGVTYPTLVQVASYIGAVWSRLMPESAWVDGRGSHPRDDRKMLRVATDTYLPVFSWVRNKIAQGAERSIYATVLDQLEAARDHREEGPG